MPVQYFSRRAFLGSSVVAAATPALLFGQDPAPASPQKGPDGKELFKPDTLFAIWQRDPTTTMTIQWIGSENETPDTSINYRIAAKKDADAGSPWQTAKTSTKPYPMTEFKVFRCELTQLQPGAEYEFQIGKASALYRFKTMPAKATDTIHFVSGGDCGVGSHAVANNLLAAKQDPMFAIVGGDLGYDNGRSVEVSLAFIRNWSKTMIAAGNRLIPMIPGIGNHEVNGGYSTDRAKAPFYYALFDGLYPETGYTTLDFGDYLSLVLLDTGHTSPIGGEQADWLEKTLRARKDHPHTLVVNHVPAYPSHRPMVTASGKPGAGAGNREHWVPLFDKYRVPVVLEHHDHTFKRSKPLVGGEMHADGVLYLGDGSWGKLRVPLPIEKLPHLLKVSSHYHLSYHRIEGEERYHIAMDDTGKMLDVCRSGQRSTRLVPTTG